MIGEALRQALTGGARHRGAKARPLGLTVRFAPNSGAKADILGRRFGLKADFHTSPLDPPLLRQLLEHRLGLLQVQRIEAFGEPAIDRCEKIAGLLSLAPITPELRHARRGA